MNRDIGGPRSVVAHFRDPTERVPPFSGSRPNACAKAKGLPMNRDQILVVIPTRRDLRRLLRLLLWVNQNSIVDDDRQIVFSIAG
jgi:hypothetical protein